MLLTVTLYDHATLAVAPHQPLEADTVPALRTYLEPLLGREQRYLLLDLTAVSLPDAMGLADLVALRARAWEHGGDLWLVWRAEGAAQRCPRYPQLDRVFRIYPSVPDALREAWLQPPASHASAW